jgi:MraZ protein
MLLRFYSTYDLKIDAKNRLVIPAEIRKAIHPDLHGTSLVVVMGKNGVPWLYPEKCYDALVDTIPVEMSPEDDVQAYMQLKFSLADRVAWDELGRVLLPERTLKSAKIERDVTLTGTGDHLELWNRDAWVARLDYLAAHAADIERKGKVAIKNVQNSQQP